MIKISKQKLELLDLSAIINDKEKFVALMDKLDIQLQDKNSATARWDMGKAIADFMNDVTTLVNPMEINKMLVDSIGMGIGFWLKCVRFYYANPNGEYKKYPLWVCRCLLGIRNRSTRKIMTVGYDEGMVRNSGDMHRWSDIIEHGKIKPLSPPRLLLLELLLQSEHTTESLVMKTGILKSSIRGKVASLNNLYGYNIINKNYVYHLIPNDIERKKMLSDTKLQIKECTKIAETKPDIEELERSSTNGKSITKNHIVLSHEAIQNIIGLLLGDGSLSRYKEKACYRHTDKNPRYINFLDSLFKSFGFSINKKLDVKRKHGKYRESRLNTKSCKALFTIYKRFYLIDTKFCPCCEIEYDLETVNYDEWKDKRHCPVCGEHDLFNKIVPADIEITPTMLKRWYEGDGSRSSIRLTLCTNGFLPEHVDLLVEKFREIGIECKHTGRLICVYKKSETKKFFDFIGPCEVDCYAYKWSTEDELVYQVQPIDWSKLDLVDILKLRKADYSWKQIGEKYGVLGHTLRKIVKSMVSEKEFLEYERYIMTPDEIKKKRRIKYHKDRITMPLDKIAKRNIKTRDYQRKIRASRSPAEKAKHLAKRRKNRHKKDDAMTPAQRDECNAKRRREWASKTSIQKAVFNTKRRARHHKRKTLMATA